MKRALLALGNSWVLGSSTKYNEKVFVLLSVLPSSRLVD